MNLGLFTIVSSLVTICSAQTFISEHFNSFAIKLLQKAVEKKGTTNIAFSPVPIVGLLSFIQEEATYDLVKQLNDLFNISGYENDFIERYWQLFDYLSPSVKEAQLEADYTLYANKREQLNSFGDNFRITSNSNVQKLDLNQREEASREINSQIRRKTDGRIQSFVSADELIDAEFVLTNILNFKAKWNISFNSASTFRASFKNEKYDIIGYADYLDQVNNFRYAYLESLDAEIIELKYGMGDQMSMILIKPVYSTVENMLNLISKTTIEEIIQNLRYAVKEVWLPKFDVTNTLDVKEILSEMGIANIFNKNKSTLRFRNSDYMYISSILQTAEIQVNQGPDNKIANDFYKSQNFVEVVSYGKPFIYFIINKLKNTIVFTGQVANPTN